MESWVTIAETDEQCWKSLALFQSLVKSGTTKPATIFTGKQVTTNMRFFLGHFFDLVQPLPANFNLTSDLATFTPWTTCVELKTNCLVLANIDELFEPKATELQKSGDSQVFVWFRGASRLISVATNKVVLTSSANPELIRPYWTPVLATLAKLDRDMHSSIMTSCPLPATAVSACPTQSCFDLDLPMSESIAIIGMSCRFPGANCLEEYWEILKEGRYTVTRFPKGRVTFDLPGIEESVVGFLSCPIDEFDASFFNIDEKEAWAVDPQQRLLLEVAWESLEDAGIDTATLRGTNGGIFIGNLLQDYERMIPSNDLTGLSRGSRELGNTLSGLSGRLSRFLGLTGPSLSHEAGCSSGLGALHLACESLLRGDCSVGISGAVNLVLLPRAYNTAVLSHDFKCKTFDESADGFVSGEAVGTFVLKRYHDAVRDGDRIRAVIRGTAMSNDGASLCYGTPNPEAHARTHKLALTKAGVLPRDVSYVETHGTGTQKGDIGEVFGIAEAYGVNRKSPLLIGSVKQNIGHGEAAAAVGSIVKLILALEKEAIPPNIFLNKVNPKIDLDAIPAQIPTELTPWVGPGRLAGLSSFSLTGSLVHAIFQSTPIQDCENLVDPFTFKSQLICISAKNKRALQYQIANYIKFFGNNLTLAIADVAMATNLGRTHFNHRIALVVSNLHELIRNLEIGQYLSGVAMDTKELTDVIRPENDADWTPMLEQIAEKYVHGENFNWTLWFGRRQKVIDLPFYPFQRQKHWFYPTDFPAVMKKKKDEDTQLIKVHPLCGYRIPTPCEVIFQNEVAQSSQRSSTFEQVMEILIAASVFQDLAPPEMITLECIEIYEDFIPDSTIQTTVGPISELEVKGRMIYIHTLVNEQWRVIASALLRNQGILPLTAPTDATFQKFEVEENLKVKGHFFCRTFLDTLVNGLIPSEFPFKINLFAIARPIGVPISRYLWTIENGTAFAFGPDQTCLLQIKTNCV